LRNADIIFSQPGQRFEWSALPLCLNPATVPFDPVTQYKDQTFLPESPVVVILDLDEIKDFYLLIMTGKKIEK
jgi:hypothetical protein